MLIALLGMTGKKHHFWHHYPKKSGNDLNRYRFFNSASISYFIPNFLATSFGKAFLFTITDKVLYSTNGREK